MQKILIFFVRTNSIRIRWKIYSPFFDKTGDRTLKTSFRSEFSFFLFNDAILSTGANCAADRDNFLDIVTRSQSATKNEEKNADETKLTDDPEFFDKEAEIEYFALVKLDQP